MKKLIILLVLLMLLVGCDTVADFPATPAPVPTLNTFPLDKTIDGWSQFAFSFGSKESLKENTKVMVEDGKLWFTIGLDSTYLYLINDQAEYSNVEMTARFVNVEKSDNYLTFVCRYTPAGWYEFNISSSGYAAILKYDAANGYTKLGSDQNETVYPDRANPIVVTAQCNNDELIMTINGKTTYKELDSSYSSGKIGISVGSNQYNPVKVGIDQFNWIELQ